MFVRAANLSYIVLTAREVHRLAVQSIAEIDATTLDDAHRRALLDYLEMAADSMMNSPF